MMKSSFHEKSVHFDRNIALWIVWNEENILQEIKSDSLKRNSSESLYFGI